MSASYLLSPKDEVLLSLSQLVHRSRVAMLAVLRTMRTPTQTPTNTNHPGGGAQWDNEDCRPMRNLPTCYNL